MSERLSEDQMDQLESWIGTGPKTFTLLYSITRDGCDASTFHQKCDGQGPTVTVLYNPHGSIYGGYTSVSWKTGGLLWEWLPDDKAFLFQLQFSGKKKLNKFPFVKGPDYAIYPLFSHGPTFGFGNGDNMFTFKDKEIKQANGKFALNGSLQDGIFKNSKDIPDMNASDVNNGNMNVTELQVYRVTDSRPPKYSPTPWRKVPEINHKFIDQLKGDIEKIKPATDVGISEFRILMLGPVGSGKSSFYNTVDSIFRGRISRKAPCGTQARSTTTKLMPYKIKTKPGEHCKLQLCDTPGFLETFDQDILDYIFCLSGHIPDFYKFSTDVAMTALSPDFVQRPDLGKRAHCIAIVLDGSTVNTMTDEMISKIKFLKKAIDQRAIPLAFVVTKVDMIDESLANAAYGVFTSKKASTTVNMVSTMFGVSRNSVYPVKNYEHEVELDDQVSALALMALGQLLYMAEDYTETFVASGTASSISYKPDVSEQEITESDSA